MIGMSLALVLGLAAGSSAQFIQPDVSGLEVQYRTQQVSLGGLATKDSCDIWSDEWFPWDDCEMWYWGDIPMPVSFMFKKYLDPDYEYNSCQYPEKPIFPFNVESMHLLLWIQEDTVDAIIELDIEEPGEWDPDMGCYLPGTVLWTSSPFSLHMEVPAGYYTLYYWDFIFPSWWVHGPFFISWHVVDVQPPDALWGWCADLVAPTHGCSNWLRNPDDGLWYNWNYHYGKTSDWIFRADGRPAWNVAVDMGSFEAVPGDQMVTLNWQSMSETNNSHWIVKRDEVEIAQRDGQGNKETSTDYVYVDRDVVNGVTYSYTIEAVNYEGFPDVYGPVTATPLASGAVPGEFALLQNYPNPFNASTVIRYQLASDEHVTLKIYNIQGQEVASLVDADQKAGMYTVNWTGKDVSSGMYIYTLTAGDFSDTKKMVFLK
ncbi:T9SS type A sorting domain-containing protein [bacterium]|nr:T9SS type A sorting domain-containing protein [bacterium]